MSFRAKTATTATKTKKQQQTGKKPVLNKRKKRNMGLIDLPNKCT